MRLLSQAHLAKPYLLPTHRGITTSVWRSAARTHGRLIKSGTTTDTYSWNNILTTYSRCVGLEDARKVFDEIPHRDAVSWNALIAAQVSCRHNDQAPIHLKSMMVKEIPFDQYTLASILKSVAATDQFDLGCQLHSLAAKTALDRNVFSGSAIVDMYAKCGKIGDSFLALMVMPEPNTVSWNSVISGYARIGDASRAFALLDQMETKGMSPDEATFASILTLVDDPAYYKLMSQVHVKIVKLRTRMDTIVYNAAITAYSECGSIMDSRKIFDEMEGDRDLVTWNSMLAAYAFHGLMLDVFNLFVQMQEFGWHQDMYTFTSAISACFEHGLNDQGRLLHGLAIKRGLDGATPVSNALISMYIRSSRNFVMDDAMKCFDTMEYRDSVSWNSILTGLSQNGLGEEVLKYFGDMHSAGLKIDHYAFSATVRSCSDLAVLHLGQQLHGLAFNMGFASNEFVASSLIYMYSKCGAISDARRSFEETCKESSVTWNSLIFGYAQHGQGQTSLSLFREMQDLGVEPDHITFVGLLSACSHIGLVEEGSMLLDSMESVYGVPLRMEHYACGVDLFGRSGKLDEAMKLIKSMPFEPDAMVWMTLLGACRVHGNIELASHIGRHLLVLEPQVHSTYVLLSNIYAGFGMWDDRATIQKMMRDKRVSKVPGWSWIEIQNKLHSFNAEDRSHPQAEEIYETLELLMENIEMTDNVFKTEVEMINLEFV